MKQINNGFAEYYYLSEDGIVYDKANNKIINPRRRHLYYLMDNEGHYRQITQRSLYKLVYNKQFCIDEIENIDNEVWKEIHDTDHLYFISNKGRVKSYKSYNAIVLKPYTNQRDYERVDIIQYGKRKSVLVHRLVAQAFLPIPNYIDMQLHHKDFNKHNNAVENLQWLTATEHLKKHTKI